MQNVSAVYGRSRPGFLQDGFCCIDIRVYPLPREEPPRSAERPRGALLLFSELRLFDTLGRDVEREDTELLRLDVLRCVRDGEEDLTFSRDDTECTRAAGWLRSRACGCTR